MIRLVEIPPAAMTALLNDDLDTASTAAGVPFTGYFVTGEAKALWRLRLDQVARDPRHAPWIVRAAVTEPDGVVVGHAGFHGAPTSRTAANSSSTAPPADPARRSGSRRPRPGPRQAGEPSAARA